MPQPSGVLPFFILTVLASMAALSPPASSQDVKKRPKVEKLLKSGWQIAGFASAGNGRNSFMLFKHPKNTYLVQCVAGYDVTRTPREFVICYTLR